MAKYIQQEMFSQLGKTIVCIDYEKSKWLFTKSLYKLRIFKQFNYYNCFLTKNRNISFALYSDNKWQKYKRIHYLHTSYCWNSLEELYKALRPLLSKEENTKMLAQIVLKSLEQ